MSIDPPEEDLVSADAFGGGSVAYTPACAFCVLEVARGTIEKRSCPPVDSIRR